MNIRYSFLGCIDYVVAVLVVLRFIQKFILNFEWLSDISISLVQIGKILVIESG